MEHTENERTADRSVPVSRRSFVRATGTTAMLGAAGCVGYGDGGGDEDNPDEVVIGSNHPLTGPTAYTGTRMDEAVKLAATMKNEEGGIESMDGAEVRVISEDNQGEQELGSEAAQSLVDDGADVLTGCFSSPVTEDATRIAESEEVPFVISAAADADILQESPLEYVYRPQPSSLRMAENHAQYLTEVAGDNGLNVETAGLFYLDNSYGQSIRDGLREALPAEGIEIIEETAINFGQTAETQVTEFRNADPDAIIATSFEGQTVELVKAMKDQDYMPPVFGGVANAAFTNPPALEEMGEIVNGAITTGYSLDVTSDEVKSIQERYQEEYGEPLDPASPGMAFGAAQVIIEVFEEAGSADSETLKETLDEIEVSDHVMAMPPVTFDENGENENAMAVLQQVQDLAPHVVYPEKYAETDPAF